MTKTAYNYNYSQDKVHAPPGSGVSLKETNAIVGKFGRHKQRLCLFLALLIITINIPIPVFSLSKEYMQKFSQNDIMFYNPEENNCNYDSGECHAPAGTEITWIGDSYSVGSVDIIKETFSGVDLGTENPGNGFSPYSYIQSGKHMDWISRPSTNDTMGGPSGIDILKSIADLRPVVVFALGTNDNVADSALVSTLDAIAGIVGEDKKVILTTAYTRGGGGYESNNETKLRYASEHENFYVADWAKVAKDDYYASDSVHPTDGEGYKQWVETIKNALPQTCSGTSTNEIVNINGYDYTFPLLGATKSNYLNPGGKNTSELSKLPCGAGNLCHHDYNAVDMGLRKLEVDGSEMTENDFPDIKGQYDNWAYYSTGVKVLAFVSGTISSYKYYHNGVPNGYSSRCSSVTYRGDDGKTYWLGHMSYDPTIHEGTHFNVGDVIGEIGPPPCAQGTQGHLHLDVQKPHFDRYVIDLMDQLYERLPDGGSPNTSYASSQAGSSSASMGSKMNFGGDLPQETIAYLDGNNVKGMAEQNMERYAFAEQQTGIPWQALAALHFREGGMRPEASISNGEELYDHTNVDGIHVSSDPNQDAVDAANHLKELAKSVYGVEISASSTLEDWGNAFLAYNRGFMYKNGGATWDQSPYVANGMDENHMNMTWIHADSWNDAQKLNSVEGKKDGNLAGAIAVMKYLGGELGGGSGICRNTNNYVTGGLTEEQANALAAYYKSEKVTVGEWNLPVGTKWNCVSLTAWFVQQFTTIGKHDGWPNGKDVVNFLKETKGVQTGTEPRPLAVFSVTQGVTMCGDGHKCGHTGIVLAVNGDDVTILEAAYGQTGYTAVVHRDKSYFTNTKYNNESFAYLDSMMNQNELRKVLAEMGV